MQDYVLYYLPFRCQLADLTDRNFPPKQLLPAYQNKAYAEEIFKALKAEAGHPITDKKYGANMNQSLCAPNCVAMCYIKVPTEQAGAELLILSPKEQEPNIYQIETHIGKDACYPEINNTTFPHTEYSLERRAAYKREQTLSKVAQLLDAMTPEERQQFELTDATRQSLIEMYDMHGVLNKNTNQQTVEALYDQYLQAYARAVYNSLPIVDVLNVLGPFVQDYRDGIRKYQYVPTDAETATKAMQDAIQGMERRAPHQHDFAASLLECVNQDIEHSQPDEIEK